MKKTLLKTVFICLGITMLCGLYSFRIPEEVKSPQSNRTASIVCDTIITPDGEESRCIKEVVVEGDQSQCTCTLVVVESASPWSLKINKSCTESVRVTIKCLIYYKDGSSPREFNHTQIIHNNGDTPVNIPIGQPGLSLEDRELENSRCVPIDIIACFD